MIKECYDICSSYSKLLDHKEDVLVAAENAASDASSWSSKLRTLFRNRALHLQVGQNKSFTSSLNLRKFSADSKETVFEFFKKFDQLTKVGYNGDQRSMLLYNSFLEPHIKQEVAAISSSYSEMKKFLERKYGRIRVIVEAKLDSLVNRKFPSNLGTSALADHVRFVYSVLAEIKNLPNSSDLDPATVKAHAYNHEALAKVLHGLPTAIVTELLLEMSRLGHDNDYFEGEPVFEDMLTFLKVKYSNLALAAKVAPTAEKPPSHAKEKSGQDRKEGAMPKKQVNSASRSRKASSSSDEDALVSVHHADSGKNKGKTSAPVPQASTSAKPKAKWYDPKLKFPCPIQGHSHELGTCTSFFKYDAKKRLFVVKAKLCFSCLRPWDQCKNGCSRLSKLPTRLVCQNCAANTDGQGRTPLSILVCPSYDHDKLTKEQLATECEKYFPGFKSKQMVPVMAPTINLVALVTRCKECKNDFSKCTCKGPASRSSPSDPDSEVPIIDTFSGDSVDPVEDNLVDETLDEAMFIMQVLNLRGEDVLTFFDRGANQNLVCGPLAERLNLKVLDPRNTPIGVVGGGRIWTEYGLYQVALGPTPEGKFFKLSCQGISKITPNYPSYALNVVNKAVVATGRLGMRPSLPSYVGGSSVQLLVGLKDARLDPVLMFTLPCGLGVYQSPLKDKFGSRICYGGPHKIFSEVNMKEGGNVHHFSIFFSQIAANYRNSLYPALSHLPLDLEDCLDSPLTRQKENPFVYALPACSETGIVVHPTPLTLEDTVLFDSQIVPQDTIDFDSSSRSIDPQESVPLAAFEGHYCSVYKAKVPLSKLIKFIDEEDISSLVNYRCPACAKCIRCLESNRTKTLSLQEAAEQHIIERSVHIDTELGRVFIDYPFLKPPHEFLQKFHKGSTSNRYQALRAYIQQCRKPNRVREGIRKAHRELVERGFMAKFSDLTPEQQELINNSSFQHYFTWSSVEKESTSTPVRIVVDPSRTGFNLILAKGENNMVKIFDVLVRNRCRTHVFSTDITKLYNQLYLNDSALPFSLFLYSDELDPDSEPCTWVLTRAWYGVRPTGNQSGQALDSLAEMSGPEFPLGKSALLSDRYVDDIFSGAQTEVERDNQVSQVQSILSKGGFSLKYVAKSREAPPEAASGGEDHLKILGYKWNPLLDEIGPGFEEINFNKKVRGAKKPNVFPVVSPDDVSRLLESTSISRRIVVSKMAELYDPIGIIEPYKLQLKLNASHLNGMDWDCPIPHELQSFWHQKFTELLDIPKLSVKRCVIPINAVSPSSCRLLCFSDAAEFAAGTAIYASYLCTDGSYSCQLLTAKSKLINLSIPRNELTAILLMAEMSFVVAKALADMVDQLLFFTDSTIAMCWVMNTSKKLRMFVHNRVVATRRYMEWACKIDDGPLPLYHIAGEDNIADLLTKEHPVTPLSLGPSSEWMLGKSWMSKGIDDMPITRYSEIAITASEADLVSEECFLEPEPITVQTVNLITDPVTSVGTTSDCQDSFQDHCSTCHLAFCSHRPTEHCFGALPETGHCVNCNCVPFILTVSKVHPPAPTLLPVISLGWRKSVAVMTSVIKFAHILIHRTHLKTKKHLVETNLASICRVCKYIDQRPNTTQQTRSKDASGTRDFLVKPNVFLGEDYWFRCAACDLRHICSKTVLDSFTLVDGIYMYTGRLSEEFPVVSADLDINTFFDNLEFKTVVPVLHSSSPVFFSYVIHIHDYVRPHSGVELTFREVTKRMHVISNPRVVISKIRRDCVKCRYITRKTLELEMAMHGAPRTVLAPPFHSVQMDIMYFPFKSKPWKNARQRMNVYALVIVCLLTSATSILILEGLETQDVCTALTRHSSRYGAPRNVYVDSGTQLVTLSAATLNIRDINTVVHTDLGIMVKPSNPKSHEERGRVEAKVRLIRCMLEKLSVNSNECLTPIGWETLFSRIANNLDDLPLAKGNCSKVADFGFEIITPNRLKLGRNNNRSLDDSFFLNSGTDVDILEACRKNQRLWYQLFLDRLHHLIPRPRKWSKTDKVELHSVVLFVHKDSNMQKDFSWSLGKVIDVKDRKLVIEYYAPGHVRLIVTRSPRQVSVIHSVNELPVNTVEYYENNILKN